MATLASEQTTAFQAVTQTARRISAYLSLQIFTFRQDRAQKESARFLRSEIARLREISPHLLIDIGAFEIENLPAKHQKHSIGNGV